MFIADGHPHAGRQAAAHAAFGTDDKCAIAHLAEDGRTHGLLDHLEAVAHDLQDDLEPLGLGDIGYLLGLSHDIGKATLEWQDAIGEIRDEQEAGRRPTQ